MNQDELSKAIINIIKKEMGALKGILPSDLLKNLEKIITEKTGLNVKIKNNKKNKGIISFSYQELNQLNKIIDIIKSYY